MSGWLDHLNDDPRGWLLEESNPAVRTQALQRLLGQAAEDPQVVASRAAAMAADPIARMLAAQQPDGHWGKPGPGYTPKYTATVWQIIILDQLGADPDDPRVRAACQYVLTHTLTRSGGFGCSGSSSWPPPDSSVLHCLNGNLVAALIGFGWIGHDGVRAAIEWACRAILGGSDVAYSGSGTTGPGFACWANQGRPCAWGANKELRALARIPEDERSPEVLEAIADGVDFLFSVDPAGADYPRVQEDPEPSPAWFRPSFPLGYTSDVLETLEVLASLGLAGDPRLDSAYEWLISGQDEHGRWRGRRILRGPLPAPVEQPGRSSKWVTLRAATALRARYGD